MAPRVSRLAPVCLILFALLAVTSFVFAVLSPLQQGREAIWVFGALSGVLALCLFPIQPLLALPGLRGRLGRWVHPALGGMVIALSVAHVAGLWVYSPEDITDALLLRAPTPFSAWGLSGLAGLVGAALIAGLRRLFRPGPWTILHLCLAGLGVAAALMHGWLILGAMSPVSKGLLAAATLVSFCLAMQAARATLVRRAGSGDGGKRS